MPKQLGLNMPDDYAPFERGEPFPDDYPKYQFTPLNSAFNRKGRVLQDAGKHKREFTVDLSIGECDCQKGVAWRWSAKDNHWFRSAYCGHKLRMIAGIVHSANDIEKPDLTRDYLKALATRYNKWECVSAFHKELRRGDFEAAWFFGVVLSTHRSIRGVIEYLINILYEETRDHELGHYLLKLRTDRRAHTLANMSRAISWFCAAIKKWELPRRYSVFSAEMHGYRLLAKAYSPEVAKGGNIILADQKSKLVKFLKDGAATGDMVKFQRGLKGLQKLQFSTASTPSPKEYLDYRYWIYETLYDIADKLWDDADPRWGVIEYVNERQRADLGIGYHELNAIGDAITGEPYADGLLSPVKRDIARNRPPAAVPLGKWPPIPLYASDNHTWAGKALLRRFPDQLKPGATQTDLDFRYCGAYFGVAYRMISQHQHGRVADWHETKWPEDLYNITQTLWY